MSEPDLQQRGHLEAGADWQSLARSAAHANRAGGEEDEILRGLLVFLLDGMRYAIPVERVREIVRMRGITPLPHVPDEIRGVISLRGAVVQVVDLRLRLDLDGAGATRQTRIIVLHGEDGRVAGVLVDAVQKVVRVPEAEIRPDAAGQAEAVVEIFLHGEDFVSILDLDRILECRDAR